MLPVIARGDPGIDRPIVIDGQVLSIMPIPLELAPDAVGEYQDMLDGGAREWQRRPHFGGIANHMDRLTINLGYAPEGPDREKLELIRATGGVHRLVLWRMVPFVFTCIAGLQRYYLPRMRRCAAWVYDGLLMPAPNAVTVSTDAFPTDATFDGDALAVTYAEGPALADPGAGGIVIARQPDTSGAAIDFTAFMLGDVPVGGEVVVIWTAPTFEVSMREPRMRLSAGQEVHSYTFVEL